MPAKYHEFFICAAAACALMSNARAAQPPSVEFVWSNAARADAKPPSIWTAPAAPQGPFAGHRDNIFSIAISPDGKYAVTASADKTLRVWDIAAGECLRVLKPGEIPARSAAFSPDGKYMLSGWKDGSAKLWDAASGALLRDFAAHQSAVQSVAFSPDGKTAATAGEDGQVALWDAVSWKQLKSVPAHESAALNLQFTPDGKSLLSCGMDNALKLWGVAAGSADRDLGRLDGRMAACAVSPDGKYALAAGWSGLEIFNLSGKAAKNLEAPKNPFTPVNAGFGADGAAYAAGADGTLLRWNAASGKLEGEIDGNSFGVTAAAFSADGTLALYAGADNSLFKRAASGGDALFASLAAQRAAAVAMRRAGTKPQPPSLDVEQGETPQHYMDRIAAAQKRFDAEVAAHNAKIAALPAGTFSDAVSSALRDACGAPKLATPLYDDATGRLSVRAVSGCAELAFTLTLQGKMTKEESASTAQALRSAKTEVRLRLDANGLTAISAAISAAGKKYTADAVAVAAKTAAPAALESALYAADDIVHVAGLDEAATAAIVGRAQQQPHVSATAQRRIFSGHTGDVTSAVFSPDGRYILSGSLDGTARLWYFENGRTLRMFKTGTWIFSVAISQDGRYALSAGADKKATLWDLSNGTKVRELAGHTGMITSVSFSPDGKTALTAGGDGTARLWNAADGAQLAVMEAGGGKPVKSAAFSPDGKYIVAGGADNTVALWRTGGATPLRTMTGHTGAVESVSFSPDGKYILSAGADKTLKLWDAATGAQLRTFSGHTAQVESAAFSPDGRYILSSGADKILLLWETATGQRISALSGHRGQALSAAFSPDGKYALSGGEDGELLLWNLPAN